ncbi:hypothetical protein PM082_007604 [Marasmius tenuissimus]|nr:hypothetical protein PM082_007604 [Marasmius tenuissimus]
MNQPRKLTLNRWVRNHSLFNYLELSLDCPDENTEGDAWQTVIDPSRDGGNDPVASTPFFTKITRPTYIVNPELNVDMAWHPALLLRLIPQRTDNNVRLLQERSNVLSFYCAPGLTCCYLNPDNGKCYPVCPKV